MKFEAVIFDLDGTLADTLADIAASCNAALERLDAPIHPQAAYLDFVGWGLSVLCRHALEIGADGDLDDPRIEQLREYFGQEYAGRYLDRTVLYDGVAGMLDELRDQGVRLAVFSNKPHEFTLLVVEALCGTDRFEIVLGQTDAIPRKPDPAGALHIAGEMGLPPETFLFLGDTAIDMQTAANAGMYPVAALWGFRDEKELREGGARTLIRHPSEFPALLGEGAIPC